MKTVGYYKGAHPDGREAHGAMCGPCTAGLPRVVPAIVEAPGEGFEIEVSDSYAAQLAEADFDLTSFVDVPERPMLCVVCMAPFNGTPAGEMVLEVIAFEGGGYGFTPAHKEVCQEELKHRTARGLKFSKDSIDPEPRGLVTPRAPATKGGTA